MGRPKAKPKPKIEVTEFFENHLTIDEFVKLMRGRYTKHTIYRWVGQGLPNKRLSGRLWFPKKEAIEWVLKKG